MTRPCPWLSQPAALLADPPGAGAGPLVGWHPADFAERPAATASPPAGRPLAAELALRAFLDQPLILYGHHDDLPEGLESLLRGGRRRQPPRPDPLVLAGRDRGGELRDPTRGLPALPCGPYSRRIRLAGPRRGDRARGRRPPGSDSERPAQHLLVDGRPARFGEPVGVAAGSTVVLELRSGERDRRRGRARAAAAAPGPRPPYRSARAATAYCRWLPASAEPVAASRTGEVASRTSSFASPLPSAGTV